MKKYKLVVASIGNDLENDDILGVYTDAKKAREDFTVFVETINESCPELWELCTIPTFTDMERRYSVRKNLLLSELEVDFPVSTEVSLTLFEDNDIEATGAYCSPSEADANAADDEYVATYTVNLFYPPYFARKWGGM